MNLLEEIKFASEFWAIFLPFILMLIDILTGLVCALINKNFQSSKMREGLGHKTAESAVIALGILAKFAFNWNLALPSLSVYICIMEVGSIYENLKKLGFKADKEQFKEIVNNIKNKEEE